MSSNSKHKESVTDIAIIGAGMVGASLVHLLQPSIAQGTKVTLIERQELRWDGEFASRPPSFDGRATALSYGTQVILDKIGVWPTLAERACAIRHVQVSDQGHFGQTHLHAEEQGTDALGYIVENAVIGQGLLAGLDQADIDIKASTQVEQVQMNAEGALLSLNNGERLQTKLLVLADGARSGLAEQLGIRHNKEDYGTHALVTQVKVNRSHQHWAYERFSQHGPIAFLPLNEQDYVVVWALPKDQIARIKNMPEAEFLAHLQSQVGDRIGTLVKVGERASYPLSLVLSTEQVRRSLVLLGNAAHGLHPVAGQGFNLALRDTAVLAEHLNRAIAAGTSPGDLDLLMAYQQQQANDQRNTILLSDLLPKVFGSQQMPVRLLRNLGLVGMSLAPTTRKLFARHAMGLGHRAARVDSVE